MYIERMRKLIGSEPIILNSSGIILLDEFQRVLLEYRRDTEDWGIPGGYMELGETFQETIRRELSEELAIQVRNLRLFDIFSGSDFYHEYPNGDKVYCVIALFTADEYEGSITIDNNEITDAKFFHLSSLPEKLTKTTETLLQIYRKSTCFH